MLPGGNFGHGFVSAGVAETGASTIGGNLHSSFAKVAASAMVGGSVSYLAGGKFGNGAATGAMQMAFNQLAHGDESGGAAEQSAEDFLGEESKHAGELFCKSGCEVTEDAAHAAAGNRYLGASLETNREAGWRVYKLADNTFSFTYPNIGVIEGPNVALPPFQVGFRQMSGGHTHWDSNFLFSPQDWKVITQSRKSGYGIKLYLASGDGRLQSSTPDQARRFSVVRGVQYLPPYVNFAGKRVSNS